MSLSFIVAQNGTGLSSPSCHPSASRSPAVWGEKPLAERTDSEETGIVCIDQEMHSVESKGGDSPRGTLYVPIQSCFGIKPPTKNKPSNLQVVQVLCPPLQYFKTLA